MAMINVTCAHCGVTFEKRAYDVGRVARVFCSKACWHARLRAEVAANPPVRSGEWRTCETCGERFYLNPALANDPNRAGRFCSRPCAQPSITAAHSGARRSAETRARMSIANRAKPKPGRRKPPVAWTCIQCGKSHEWAGTRTAWASKRLFCDRACRFAHMREHPEMNGRFRGGHDKYMGPAWTERATQARERDGYACQDCGAAGSGQKLDVHHLIPRRIFAGDWDTANDLDNLITLCARCHSRWEVEISAHYRDHPVIVERSSHILRGSANRAAKLTEEHVRAIVEAWQDGGCTIIGLSRTWGVNQSAIAAIVKGRTWRHVTAAYAPLRTVRRGEKPR
jgi:5-methylcytosine-specific restriction endonuclease McrA